MRSRVRELKRQVRALHNVNDDISKATRRMETQFNRDGYDLNLFIRGAIRNLEEDMLMRVISYHKDQDIDTLDRFLEKDMDEDPLMSEAKRNLFDEIQKNNHEIQSLEAEISHLEYLIEQEEAAERRARLEALSKKRFII